MQRQGGEEASFQVGTLDSLCRNCFVLLTPKILTLGCAATPPSFVCVEWFQDARQQRLSEAPHSNAVGDAAGQRNRCNTPVSKKYDKEQ